MSIFRLLSLISLLGMAVGATANSPWLSRVYDYCPAPGQFINVSPEFETGDTYEDIIAKTTEQLCGDKTPGLISLGAFGGYVVVGFDHPVVNTPGQKDFKIYGNAFRSGNGGASEPGIVMVAVDANGNGLPDDQWYELAGSEYTSSDTFHSFEITYHKPAADKVEVKPENGDISIVDAEYIKFTTNDPDMPIGYVEMNTFHRQSYWPEWVQTSEIKFVGTRLKSNAVKEGKNWQLVPYDWGYADNIPNDECEGFDISWAVDEKGNSVKLTQIDFIKIYTAVSRQCGWIGETSTEVAGGEDLHPDVLPTDVDEVLAANDFEILSSQSGIIVVKTTAPSIANLYSISGSKVDTLRLDSGLNTLSLRHLSPGIYLLVNPTTSAKILL